MKLGEPERGQASSSVLFGLTYPVAGDLCCMYIIPSSSVGFIVRPQHEKAQSKSHTPASLFLDVEQHRCNCVQRQIVAQEPSLHRGPSTATKTLQGWPVSQLPASSVDFRRLLGPCSYWRLNAADDDILL